LKSEGDGLFVKIFACQRNIIRSIKHTRQRPTIYVGTSILEAGRQTERPREKLFWHTMEPIWEPSLKADNFFGLCHGVVSRVGSWD